MQSSIDRNAIKRPLTREFSAPFRLNRRRESGGGHNRNVDRLASEALGMPSNLGEPGFEVRRSCLQIVFRLQKSTSGAWPGAPGREERAVAASV
jgi:hypothetical protein